MLTNIVVLVLLIACGSASDDSYRLPIIYKPLHYDLNLTVLPAAFTSENNTFTGIAAITFTVSESTSTIQLHSNPSHINISSITLNATVIPSSNYSVNSTTEILTITLSSITLTTNEYYLLNIGYVGTLVTNAMDGFYKSSYNTTDAETHYLVTTHLEPTSARKVFPCWDEPNYKATYNISLKYPNGYSAIANTESVVNDNTTYSSSNLTETTFAKTPLISTYLIAFIISNFTGTEGDVLEGNSTMSQKVWSRPTESEARIFALNLTSKYVDLLNNYTNVNYSVGLNKLDQVAIPDFGAGAMENWGLITYRESGLLYYENDTSNMYKEYIARVIAHELSHQWFGNLVTLKWWSETFLNEGFATYFEYYISYKLLPDYELKKQFVIKVLQYAFPEDSSTTVKAITANATTPSEITAKFNTINYDKAGSILRMVEHFLGKDTFQTGLQNYLSTYKFQNVEPHNLWSSFNITNVSLPTANLSLIMDNWINNAGFPLVTVSWNKTSSQLQITQERFLYSGIDPNSTWYVPISYTTSENTTAFENTLPITWLTPTSDVVVNVSGNLSWIVLNNQQTGYYRVNYASNLWSGLTLALQKTNFSGIIEQNRAQIVDDAFNLARAAKLNYSTVFSIVDFLKNDTSYITWYPAFNGFNFILQRVGLNSSIGQKTAAHILNLTESLRNSVPMNATNSSNHIYGLKQQLVNSWACKLGHNSSVAMVQQIYDSYKKTGVKPDKNLRNVVYCNALRHSKNITEDWAFLWSEFENTSLAMEKTNIISGLGCATDETILKSYLEKTLTNNSGIRSQDYASVMSSVYTGSNVGVNVALDFLIANFSSIQSRYTSKTVGSLFTGIAKYFTTEAQVLKLQSFAANNTLDSVVLTEINSALATANDSLAWVSLHKSDLHSYYGIRDDNSTTGESTDPNAGVVVPSPSTLTLVLISVFSFLLSKL